MIITEQQELTKLCQKLSAQSYITIDTEFLRERTYYPKLCLIQVSGPDQQAAAIDPIEGKLDLTPLFDILMNPNILKVIHAGRQDLEIFYRLMNGKVPAPFFDTQIAAMVCGYGESAGYENLVRDLTGHGLDKSVQFTDWSKRPLTQRQIDYALGDVIYLVEIYQKLSAELKKRGRVDWVFQEEEILASPETYENKPEDSWGRIKLRTPKPRTLAILRELAAWREREAQRKDLPRSWLMKDETLADMAAQGPKTPDQLAKIRGVSKEFAEGERGKALLKLIEKGAESDKNTWPQPEQRKIIPPAALQTIEILKMLLKIQCAQHDVAAKLVASSSDLEAIAVDDNADVPALKGWRRDVFGAEALALKAGKIAIALKNGKIVKHEIK